MNREGVNGPDHEILNGWKEETERTSWSWPRVGQISRGRCRPPPHQIYMRITGINNNFLASNGIHLYVVLATNLLHCLPVRRAERSPRIATSPMPKPGVLVQLMEDTLMRPNSRYTGRTLKEQLNDTSNAAANSSPPLPSSLPSTENRLEE